MLDFGGDAEEEPEEDGTGMDDDFALLEAMLDA
jgi:hypothetical protein|eukprot:SAG22_NODE_17894_length_297_cov_0.439394_1_plen_33_part_00